MKDLRGFVKKRYFWIVLFVIFFSILSVLADTPTEIFVQNSPPYLMVPIPNQAWPKNTNLLNAFDLDNYFTDPNGDNINYSFSQIGNITTYIDTLTHEVSFYPELDFIGEEIITFYAQDNNSNISSNPVYLYVGLDNEPPNWSSPAKSKATIYQNDIINFSMIWTDNTALNSYIFSINQGSGWSNLSSLNFSGLQNTSLASVQISAPASNQVYWRFYAWDTSNNMNVSDVQNFTISSPPSSGESPSEEEERPGKGGGGVISKILGGDFPLLPQRRLKDFRLNVYDFKLSLKQGSSKTMVLKITNIGTEGLSLNVYDVNLWNFVVFSEQAFELLPGNSKELTIDFVIPRNAFVGQYYGFIRVDAGDFNKTIPVVLDIHAIDLDFDIHLNISEKYKTVRPGEIVEANINIFNIRDIYETNASLYYAIKDFTGGLYNFSEEWINFSTSNYLNRSLQVPLDALKGGYIFYARVSDDDNIAIDSDTFEVGKKFTLESFLRNKGIFILIFIISLLLAIFMVKYQRDKRKERLINLYINLTKLKKLIQLNKQEEALQLFLKIRNDYKEPLSQELLQDKEKLKQELLKLYNSINVQELKKSREQNPLQTSPKQENSSLKKPLSKVLPKKNISEIKELVKIPIQKTISNSSNVKSSILKSSPLQKTIPAKPPQTLEQPRKILAKTITTNNLNKPTSLQNKAIPLKKDSLKKRGN